MASKDKSITTYHLCSIHQTENIQMYCSDCDHASCLKCIAGPHRGHHFDTIEDVVHKKRGEVAKYLTKVEDIISSFTSALDSVKRNQKDYSKKIKALIEMVNSKREEWKKQIDEIADKVLLQMKTMTDKDLEELKERETILTNNVAEFKEFLKTCKERERSADDLSFLNLIADLKQNEKTQKPSTVTVTTEVCPPHFVGDRIDTGHIGEVFGRMVRDDADSASDFVGSVNQSVKPHTDTTSVATITPGVTCTCVSTVGEDNAWVGYRYNSQVISLVNKEGQVLKCLDLGLKPGDVTNAGTSEVLVTDYSNYQVKKYTKDGHYINTIITTSPYKPWGLCATSDNDILVCLYQSNRDNKVIRVTTTGQTKQTVQHDKQSKPLFIDPKLVQENTNKDICVIDSWRMLVVVNKDGELRFRYSDRSTQITRISYCYGIVCDRLGNILLSDRDNHSIHLIDINGKFVQHVLDKQHGVDKPWGLSINNIGELWVCNENATKVFVIKYRS